MTPMLDPKRRTNSDAPPSHASMAVQHGGGDKGGETAIKYALIAAGIGAAIATTVYALSTTTAALYQMIADLF